LRRTAAKPSAGHERQEDNQDHNSTDSNSIESEIRSRLCAMTVDYIRYDILTQDALRSVVQTVLADAAAKGLPGEHHFLISFDTRADGVGLSPRLKAQYPKEMTIVLQHQFWDMIVTDDRFEVGLSFSGIPERLVIPFRAIRGFADPSVQFGLQFSAAADEDEAPEAESVASDAARAAARDERPAPTEALAVSADLPSASAKSAAAKPSAAKHTAAKPAAGKSAPKPAAKPAVKPEKEPDGEPATGGQVVRLDRFRKK
jgi:uncharacterized protein